MTSRPDDAALAAPSCRTTSRATATTTSPANASPDARRRTISRKRRRPAFLSHGMPKPGLVWALVLASLLGGTWARSVPGQESAEEDALATPEEALRFYDAMQQQEREERGGAYIRELALLMERLRQAEAGLLASSQQLQLQQAQAQSQEDEQLPVPLPMTQGRPPAYLQEGPGGQVQGAPREDKRSNYIGLCHFKICNMGRKRTWNPWNRN